MNRNKRQGKLKKEPSMRVCQLKVDELKDLLRDRKLAPKEFADRIMVTRIAMEWYLDGSRIPKITVVRNMAVFLKCDINDIAVTEPL